MSAFSFCGNAHEEDTAAAPHCRASAARPQTRICQVSVIADANSKQKCSDARNRTYIVPRRQAAASILIR
jgi:hypothetical protein